MNKLRQFDSYGHPINLSLDGESTYKTALGGAATIVSKIIIFSYFVYELLGVYNHDSIIKATTVNKDLTTDKTVYSFNESMIDVGVYVSSVSEN